MADGFRSWLRRLVRVTRAGGWPMFGCLLVGTLLPAAAIGLTSTVTGLASEVARRPGVEPEVTFVIAFGGAAVLAMVAAVATYVIAASFGAATWTAAVRATGASMPLRAAFRVGLRCGLPVWGWLLLVAVPVAVFEGRRAIRRSWRLAHSALWRTATRLLPLYFAVLCYTAVVSAPINAAEQTAAGAPLAVRFAANGILGLIQTIMLLPGVAVLLVGMFVTYAEVRGRRESLTAAQLTRPT